MVDLYIDQEESEQLSQDSPFHFTCHAGLTCFNQCCQKPTVILKPYDIMRLRRRLGHHLHRIFRTVHHQSSGR